MDFIFLREVLDSQQIEEKVQRFPVCCWLHTCTASSSYQYHALVTINELTLTHCCHPEATELILIICPASLGRYIKTLYSLPLEYPTEQFHCPKISSVFWLAIPPCQLLATTDPLTVSIILPFLGCYGVRITYYVAFSDWLLSLWNLHLSLLDGFLWLESSFLFSPEYHSIAWMDPRLFIHSPTNWHLGCIHILAFMKKAAINILVQVFVRTYIFNSFMGLGFLVPWAYNDLHYSSY